MNMIRLRQIFLMGICFAGHFIQAMKNNDEPNAFLFKSDFTEHELIVDTTFLSMEPKTRGLITELKNSRFSAPRKPPVLFWGQNSYHAALTLAAKLNAPYLVTEDSSILDDSSINESQRQKDDLRTIIIKDLS